MSNQPILTGDWGSSHWELIPADRLPDDAVCTAVGCVAIVDETRQMIALTRNTRSQKTWELPAGHTEAGEQPEDTLRREAYEEAGFVVSAARLFAYRKITRSPLIDSASLTDREKSYPNPSYLPYYYAYTTEPQAACTGEEISESKNFTPLELQHLAAAGLINHDELTIIQLGLAAAMRAS